MKNLIILLSTLIMMGLMQSCELEPREIELEAHDSKLAITALLTPDDTTNRMLFNVSIGILDTTDKYENGFLQNPKLTLFTPDAGPVEATIIKDIDDFAEWESDRRYRIWSFAYNEFKVGETYEIEASADNYTSVSAKCVVPASPEILDVKIIKKQPANGQYFVRDQFDIKISDDPNERNYYKIKAIPISMTEIPIYNAYRFYRNASDPLDLSALDNLITVFSDDEFNGQDYNFVLYGEIGQEQDFEEVDFTISAITEQEYRRTLALRRNGDANPFAEPIIYNSNIENGYGVFSISSPPYQRSITVE